MKAIRVHGPGGPEVLKYEEVPDPKAGNGEVLVVLEAIGVNFVDIYNRRSAPSGQTTPIGREGAGVVEAVGQGVKDFKVGDKVAFDGTLGAYAELIAVPADRLVKVPSKLTTKQAASVLLQGMTAHYLATSVYPLKKGDVCLVHAAAGGVGELLCQMAKMRGAKVIGTVSTREKAKVAGEAGADEVIVYTKADFGEEVKKLTAGKGVNVIYDSVGKTTFLKGFKVLRPLGMMVLFGQSSGPVESFDPSILAKGGSLFFTRPSLTNYTATRQDLLQRANEVFKWVADGSLKVRVFKEFPLQEAAKAHQALEERQTVGKLLLTP
ncbi:MAG TPA: quinone oxidoreductase [Candidatus Nanoarchaeia archaeon]|nr:quinone oxidoreductase 1 [uncultured archaeon]